MSNRSLIELNHDHCPHDDRGVHDMGRMFRDYMRSGNKADLPKCATFVQMRHHSGPEPSIANIARMRKALSDVMFMTGPGGLACAKRIARAALAPQTAEKNDG